MKIKLYAQVFFLKARVFWLRVKKAFFMIQLIMTNIKVAILNARLKGRWEQGW